MAARTRTVATTPLVDAAYLIFLGKYGGILPPYDEQVGDLHYQIGSACNTLAAAHRSSGRAADAAGQWKRAAGALLESRRQFTFCSRTREAKAAGEFAAVCMRQLKAVIP